jgi:hypothetical protein
MGLASVVRGAVTLADKITKDLQPSVTQMVWIENDEFGAPTYKSAVVRRALVDLKQGRVRTTTGELAEYRAAVTFLAPVNVGLNDAITLPDGTTGPILSTDGFADPLTKRGYVTTVYLG